MCKHEAGIHPAVAYQKRWQATHLRINQNRNSPLCHGANLGDRQCQLVGCEGDRFGVKVTARADAAILRKHQRIIGDGIGFQAERGRGSSHQIEARTHDLWLTAQRVGILDAFAMQV